VHGSITAGLGLNLHTIPGQFDTKSVLEVKVRINIFSAKVCADDREV
jgi:hypothetical protein